MENMKVRICRKCGEKFVDTGHIQTVLGMKNRPQLCENCRRERRIPDWGEKKIVRTCLQEFGNVRILSFRSRKTERDRSQYRCLHFGGRNFGDGARFNHARIIFVHKSLPETLDGVNVCIRHMEKTIEGEGGGTWQYFVFDPPIPEEEEVYLHCVLTHRWKYTLKGFGRQYSYSWIIESPHIVLAEAKNWANSGRYGTTYTLVVSPEEELEISETGKED